MDEMKLKNLYMVHPREEGAKTGQQAQKTRVGLANYLRSGIFMKMDNSQLKSSTDEKNFIRSWVPENVRKKECTYFYNVETTEAGKHVCACGYAKEQHSEDVLLQNLPSDQPWIPAKHTREVPTDAFGDITFTGLTQKVSKYVRVSSQTYPELLYRLMTDCWGLKVPNLLISVTGGAKNFNMNQKLKDIFRRGLIKAAQSTGAWIITGGSHAGVMKHVGEAIRDYTMSSSSKEGKIVVIGIATWGIVHNRDSLINPKGKFPAEYILDEHNQGKLSCLDNNHSHFILVDDGTHGRYGVEIPLRTKLERYISQQTIEDGGVGLNIPIVCLVLEGGPGTLDTIFNAMLNGTPCVIVEGSGRVADVIANAAKLPVSQITINHIQKQLKIYFEEDFITFSDSKIIQWTKKIQDIVRMQQLLTIFRADKRCQHDIDTAILQALLKATRSHDHLGRENWEHQLKLAVAWNRVDMAENEIFTDERQWKSSDLHEVMTAALIGDKPEFVKLLLDHGVNLKEYLTLQTLTNLYNNLSPSSPVYGMLVKELKEENKRFGTQVQEIQLHHVSHILRDLLGEFTQPLYPKAKHGWRPNIPRIKNKNNQKNVTAHSDHHAEHRQLSKDPLRDLFIWALLQNRNELANLMWEQCQDCIAAALGANKILKELAKEVYDADCSENTQSLANAYEEKAIGVFNECYRKDEERAQKLLVRVSEGWGKTTCLRLALEADNKLFIAQGGVQAFLTRVWWGEISVETRTWKVALCILIFPLIYTGFITFRNDEDIRKMENLKKAGLMQVTVEDAGKTDSDRINTMQKSVSQAQLISDAGDEILTALTCFQRFKVFYSAPVVIFCLNAVSYLGFLWLFAYILMMDFQTIPTWKEYLLYGWVFSLFCEEVKQLVYNPVVFGFYKKVSLYFSDSWNKMDLLSITVFIAGVVCRWFPMTFYYGRIVLSIDFIIFCTRLMHIFTVNKTLGPKIIIVQRMMKDIFFFLFLLAVWVLSYGVAKQSILIHNETRLDWIFRDVVYGPFLTIFGQLPSDVDGFNFDINSCSVNGTDPNLPKCAEHDENNQPVFPEWLTIILLCLYVLMINILLMNLLIAMFNYTFQQIQDHTDIIWKFQHYDLVEEYHNRSLAPPPLILIAHILLFLKRIICCSPSTKYKRFKQELPKHEDADLLIWEAFMKENYLSNMQHDMKESTDYKIRDASDKVNSIAEALEIQPESRNGTVEQRLGLLEDQVRQTSLALNWIINALSEKGFGSKERPPLIVRSKSRDDQVTPSEPQAVDSAQEHHVNARQLHYPDSNIHRFPVPDEKVPWEVEFKEYDPCFYPSEKLPLQTKIEYGQQQQSSANYNIVDGLVDRRSFCGPYQIVDGLPVNPIGRTGLKGQGHLYWLGPNLSLDVVITRWKRDSDGIVLKKGRKKMLEFLSVKRAASEHSSLPGGILEPGEKFPRRFKQIFNITLREEIDEKLKCGGQEVYKGYIDDGRNTDNAWIETTAINIHFDIDDELIESFNQVCLQTATSDTIVTWLLVDQNISVHDSHKPILQMVATFYGAHY